MTREEAILRIEDHIEVHKYREVAHTIKILEALDFAIKALKQPEIIRCRDCKHYNAGFECLIEGYGIERSADWYCADAERRTDV